ncbi:MAG: phosphoglucosamine mutase, partial [Bacteroidetes bacterium]|nr:phosphoglucosamine mutase [Bacteroidota bacterium]
ATIMESYPQVLKNVRTSSKIEIDTIPYFPETINKLENELGSSGRILVRPSGTEPVIRVMLEGEDEEVINTMADELCDMVMKADRV